jgi:hypothetical protein
MPGFLNTPIHKDQFCEITLTLLANQKNLKVQTDFGEYFDLLGLLIRG